MRVFVITGLVLALVSGGAWADVFSDAWIRGASSVAVNDDATALFVNPAGLGMYPEQNTYFSLSTIGDDVSGASLALRSGALGFGFTRQYLWESAGAGDSGVSVGDDAVDTYILALGFGEFRKWSVGFDYRWLRARFGDEEKSGTWDAGFMVRPTDYLSIGGAVRNISEPGFLTDPDSSSREDHEGSRMTYTAGLAIRPLGDRLTLMVDASLPREEDTENAVWTGGLEAEVMNGLVLRGSVQSYPVGDDREQETSFGLWLNTTHLGVGASMRSSEVASDDIMTYGLFTSEERLRTAVKSQGGVAEIGIAGPLSDMRPGWSLFGKPRKSAQATIREIRRAAKESSIDVILIRIRGLGRPFLGGPSALVQEIRDEVVRAREVHGKKVLAYLEHGAGTQEYFLATAADEIVMNQASGIDGVGNYVTVMRYTESTGKLGIEWDYMSAGKYKSTFHSIGADELTDEQREEVQSLIDGNYEEITSAIAEGRGISRAAAEKLADGRLYMPPQALEAGLVDRIGFFEDAKAAALELADRDVPDEPEDIPTTSVSGWRDKAYDWNYGPRIAIIGAYGSIDVGEGGRDPVWGGESIGSDTLVEALRRARKDPRVKAVVLRVDSGGGSGLASEIIWHETVKVAEEKPFIVSMADIAGSGGYFISMVAEKIFVEPLTITGSIGVVGMKPVLAELYDKIGATHETFKRGEHSDQWAATRHMTEEELGMARDAIDWFYEDFVHKVADGRGMSFERAMELAEGRVYTGTQAIEVGLADEFGGLSQAIDYACEAIGVEREDATIVHYREGASWVDDFLSKATSRLGLYRLLDIGEGGTEELLQLRTATELFQQ